MKLLDETKKSRKSILTVMNIDNPCENYYVIKTKTDTNFTWTPGQNGKFTLPNNTVEGKTFRIFSVASIYNEGCLLIGFRTGKEISSFKKEMISLKEGDKIGFDGPRGSFKLQDKTSPVILVAGGVGITPIRAIIKQLENDKSRNIELLYASSDFYLFEDEIQEIILNNNKITMRKTRLVPETQDALKKLLDKYSDNGCFYISGSLPFINGIKEVILNYGVSEDRIVNDTFYGY